MKRIRKIIIYIMISVSSAANAAGEAETITADKFLEVVNNLTRKYNELEGYSVNVVYRSYTSHQTTALEEETSGFIHRKGFDYSSNTGGIFMIRNERATLVVDSTDQTVVVTDSKPDFAPEMMEFESSWVNNSAKTISERITNGLKTYTVNFREGMSIKSYEFTLNASGLLYRISIYYDINREEGFGNEAHLVNYTPRLEISFGEYNLKPVFARDEFSERRILRTSDNKRYFLPEGSTFQIYDQRIVKPD
jgi:hypothetical protein